MVTFYNDGFEDNAYETSLTDEECATKFIRKSAAANIIDQFDLKKEYKIVEVK